MQVFVNYHSVTHLLCLKVTFAHVKYHVTYKLCNQYSDVVISSNATDRRGQHYDFSCQRMD